MPEPSAFLTHLQDTLRGIDAEGLTKRERLILSPQGTWVRMAGADRPLLNLCANNYLGLADHPALIAAAKQAMDDHGFGMASVRFICGTQDLHRRLETRLADYLQTDDSILFAACFDANGGLFEPLLGPEDAVISDALNHASIIDGIRLCKAERHRYKHRDMADLEACLKALPVPVIVAAGLAAELDIGSGCTPRRDRAPQSIPLRGREPRSAREAARCPEPTRRGLCGRAGLGTDLQAGQAPHS